jgi:hypothetical protein
MKILNLLLSLPIAFIVLSKAGFFFLINFLNKRNFLGKDRIVQHGNSFFLNNLSLSYFLNNKCFSVFSEHCTYLENILPLHKHLLLDISRQPIKQNNPNVILCIKGRRMYSLQVLSG